MLNISLIRHAWPEAGGFFINRRNGHPEYTFLHFITGTEIRLGEKTVSAPEHTCIIFKPGTPQYFYNGEPMLHDWMHLTGDVAELLERLKIPTDTLLYPQRSDFITEIMREMENEFYSQKSGREQLLRLKTEELFIKLARACLGEFEAAVDTSTAERIRKLRDEIFLSLGSHWTVSEMAAKVSLSESRFYGVYRSVYGTSPMDDLIRARIDAAKQALSFTSQSVGRIAESLGYNNLTHFTRQFKAMVGISPLAYRKTGETVHSDSSGIDNEEYL